MLVLWMDGWCDTENRLLMASLIFFGVILLLLLLVVVIYMIFNERCGVCVCVCKTRQFLALVTSKNYMCNSSHMAYYLLDANQKQ